MTRERLHELMDKVSSDNVLSYWDAQELFAAIVEGGSVMSQEEDKKETVTKLDVAVDASFDATVDFNVRQDVDAKTGQKGS